MTMVVGLADLILIHAPAPDASYVEIKDGALPGPGGLAQEKSENQKIKDHSDFLNFLEESHMKKKNSIVFILPAAVLVSNVQADLVHIQYPNITLSGGFASGYFEDVWDLTMGPMILSFTVDLTGMVAGGNAAHAWSEFGIRSVGSPNFNPNYAGVWLTTDYDWTANTFGPDPPNSPVWDMDDKLILQRVSGQDESYYNLPSIPSSPYINYGIWFDRDGVDPYQAGYWGAVNGGTYNTEGIYRVEMTFQATSDTDGTVYMKVNGVHQGFYNGSWQNQQPDIYPAGMTFTGDMKRMQIFYGLYGFGATHSVGFRDISAQGHVVPEPSTMILLGSGLLGLCILGWYRKRKWISSH